jgi:hypothetical protein
MRLSSHRSSSTLSTGTPDAARDSPVFQAAHGFLASQTMRNRNHQRFGHRLKILS